MGTTGEQTALTEAVYYILLSLFEPMHGYGIMQYVKQISNSRVNLGPGTMYGAINTLLEKGWIATADLEGETDTRKKAYTITKIGRFVVEQEIIRLEALLAQGKQVLDAEKERIWGDDK